MAYNIQVSKGGKTYVVQKRFSEIAAFRRMLAVESPELMMVPFPNAVSGWRKTSEKSHNARMGKLDEFLRAIIMQRWALLSKPQKQQVQSFLKAQATKPAEDAAKKLEHPKQQFLKEEEGIKSEGAPTKWDSTIPLPMSPTQIKISRTEQLTEDSPAGKSEM
jgi:hypothetical protein